MEDLDLSQFPIDAIFQYIGVFTFASFVLIGLGDFVVAAINIVVKATPNQDDDATGSKVAMWWETIKKIYEEFRFFLDRFSAFSRPRK